MSDAHVLFYPGAFNLTTGMLHWKIAVSRVKSRDKSYICTSVSAVDKQICHSMCSQARDMTAGYHAVCLPVKRF